MTVTIERVAQTPATAPEQPPQTAEELEQAVLTRLFAVADGSTYIHQLFYGDPGVSGVEAKPLIETTRSRSGCRVLVKDETTHTYLIDGVERSVSAFKRRGALLALTERKLDDPSLSEVATASSGNFAKGVSAAAAQLGMKSMIFMTKQSEPVKQKALRDMGSTLDITSHSLPEALAKAHEHTADNEKAVMLHPFEDVRVIAGQATSAFEVLDDLVLRHSRGEIDVHTDQIIIGVPFGGGGYAAATGIVFKWAKDVGLVGPQLRVVAVEPKDKPTNQLSDGTMTNDGDITSLVVRDERYVQGVISVHDEEIDEAVTWLHHVTGKVIEPAGALATTLATTGIVRGDMTLVSMMSGASVSDNKFAGCLKRAVEDGFIDRYPKSSANIMNTLASLALGEGQLPQKNHTDVVGAVRNGTRVWSGR